MLAAANEVDLYNQLQAGGLELLDCTPLSKRTAGAGLGGRFQSVKLRDKIQLLVHLEQMQEAGVSLLDSLADIRDTTESDRLRDIMSEVHRDVMEGSSLSEAMAKHPKVFDSLFVSLVSAGEDTGNLTSSYRQLIRYMKWLDEMKSKIKKATTYPMIVVCVVILVVVVMMGYVVPQIVGFIANLGEDLPFYTVALIATSDFFKAYWWALICGPLVFTVLILIFRKISDEFAYRVDAVMLVLPVMGPLIRKITIARYAQTFGALFSSGIDVIGSLRSARNTVSNLAMMEALESVEAYVQAGNTLSESFNACGEFPSLVVRMLKIGEESGNLTHVLDQVAEFYTKDVDEAVQGMISMIEPALTGLLGGMILWIAVAVFGPIYGSFENINI